jgi:predicted DNA-binding transcriptional regulator AlpA
MALLVRTPAPQPTESLFGFLLRLCQVNGYDSPRRVLEIAEVSRGLAQKPFPGLPGTPIAAVLARDPAELRPILRRWPEDEQGRYIIGGHDLGASIRDGLLSHGSPTFCPDCVKESGVISAFWDLAPAIACPKHGVVGPRTCDACKSPITWYRRGLLTCQCEASLADQPSVAATQNTVALMRVLDAKLTRANLMDLDNAVGLPMEWLDATSLHSLLRVIRVLSDELELADASLASDRVNAVAAVADSLADWPRGYHSALRTIGEKSISGASDAAGLARQFRTLYRRLFRNSNLSAEAEFLRLEFVEFGLKEWGKAAVDVKMLRGKAPREPRFISRTQFAAKQGIWAPTLDRMIADGDVVAVTQTVGKNSRTIIDLTASKIPEVEDRTAERIDVREVAKTLGLPVSVIRSLKRRPVMPIKLRRGRGTTWYRDDVDTFVKRCLALASAESTSDEAVTLEELMRLKFRSAVAKADVVEAALDGTLPVMGRTGELVSGLQFERAKVQAFIVAKRIAVDGETFSFPQAAAACGIALNTVQSALAKGLLNKVDVAGRIRIEHAAVEQFRTKYKSLAAIAGDLGSTTPALRRLCDAKSIPVIELDRDGGGPVQPIIDADRVGELKAAYAENQRLSREEIAELQVQALRSYLTGLVEAGGFLPRRGDKPNKVEIARQCGFDRNVLYGNPTAVAVLETHVEVEASRRLCQTPRDRIKSYCQALADTGQQLPQWQGRPNKLQIATACGFDRDVFRKQPELLKLLEDFAVKGLPHAA